MPSAPRFDSGSCHDVLPISCRVQHSVRSWPFLEQFLFLSRSELSARIFFSVQVVLKHKAALSPLELPTASTSVLPFGSYCE